jgi:hypothetical protein
MLPVRLKRTLCLEFYQSAFLRWVRRIQGVCLDGRDRELGDVHYARPRYPAINPKRNSILTFYQWYGSQQCIHLFPFPRDLVTPTYPLALEHLRLDFQLLIIHLAKCRRKIVVDLMLRLAIPFYLPVRKTNYSSAQRLHGIRIMANKQPSAPVAGHVLHLRQALF